MYLLAGLRPVDTEAPDRLYKDKTYNDIGVDQDFTDFLQRKLDPDGSKYGGDVERLKDGFLNDMTARKSGIVSSVVDWARSKTETTQERQLSNLKERLYESAPNRLLGADQSIGDRAEALGAGLKGGLWGEGALPLELGLNLLLSPVTLAKAGFTALRGLTLGAAAEKAAAGAAGRELTEKLATGAVFDSGAREALEQTVKSEAWRTAAKRSAAWEGGQNAALGGVGGAAEHYSSENRGIETGSLAGDVLGGAAMGGVLGGAIGGLTAIPGARSAARELVGGKPGALAKGGIKSIPERAEAQAAAAARDAEEAAAREAERAAAAAAPAPDTSARDGAIDLSVNLREMQAHVEQLAREAGVDRAASKYSRDTLGLMSDTLAGASDVPTLAARLRSDAAALTTEKSTPADNERAGQLTRDAAILDRFSTIVSDPEQRASMLASDDVHPVLAQALAVINPRLAEMMDADLAPAAPAKNKPAAGRAADAGTQPQPAPQPEKPGQAQQQAPSAGAAAPAATEPPPVAPVAPKAANNSAEELEQLRPRFTPEDTAAVSDAEGVLTKAGTDLPTALARIESDGGSAALASEVAKASGEQLDTVVARIGKMAGAITKARAAREADEAAAAAAAAAPAPAPKEAAPPAPSAPAAAAAPAKEEPAPAGEPPAPEPTSGATTTYDAIVQSASVFALDARTKVNAIVADLLDEINAQGDAAEAAVAASRQNEAASRAKLAENAAAKRALDDFIAAYGKRNPEYIAIMGDAKRRVSAMEDEVNAPVLAAVAKRDEIAASKGRNSPEFKDAQVAVDTARSKRDSNAKRIMASEKAILEKAEADQAAFLEREKAREPELKELRQRVKNTEPSRAELDADAMHRAGGGHHVEGSGKREMSPVEQKIEARLAELRADPEMGALFDGITPDMLLTRAGKDAVEARIQRAANDSIGWHYATALAPSMRDIFNVEDFSRLLSLMPGVPESGRRQIAGYYTRQARLALAFEAGRMGSASAVVAKYGDSAAKLLGESAEPRAAGKLDKAMFGKLDIAGLVDEFASGLSAEARGEIGKSLRQFRNQIVSVGFAQDERMVAAAMRARAAEAAGIAATRDQNRAIRASVKAATAEADPRFMRMLDQDEGFSVDVRRVADADWHDMQVEHGSFVPNPIVQRIVRDESGSRIPYSFADRGELVTGRVVTPGKEEGGKQSTFGRAGMGGSQGMFRLADEFGIIGRLRSTIRSAAGAAHVINENAQAFVEAAGRQRRDRWGKATKGSAGGARAEKLFAEMDGKALRMEQARMTRIVELVKKRDGGILNEDDFKAAIAEEGQFIRPVVDSEVALAREWIEAQGRISTARQIAQAEADDILVALANGGTNLEEKAASLEARLRKVFDQSGGAIRAGLKEMDSEPKAKAGGPKKAPADAVKFRSADGKDYEFVPNKHMQLANGSIKLFGQTIGTYETGDKGAIVAKIVGHPDAVVTAANINVLGKQMRKSKEARALMEANKGELVDAAPSAASVPDGEVIPEGFTSTEKVDEAVSELSGAKSAALTPEMRATEIAKLDVPAGYVVVLRENGTRNFYPAKARHKTLGDIVKDGEPGKQYTVGLLPAMQNKSGSISRSIGSVDRAMAQFVPYGRDPGKVSPDTERVMQAVGRKKSSAPALADAQRGPITYSDAERIVLESGETLAKEHERFLDSLFARGIPATKAEFDEQLAALERTAAEFEALVPHGIVRPAASRRTSYAGLVNAMSKASSAEREVALDFLRRIDGGGRLPHIYSGPQDAAGLGSGSFSRSKGGSGAFNSIAVTPGGAMPGHINVVHEVAHWAYVNLLTPSEQVEFMRTLSKLYGDGGIISLEKFDAMIPSARALEQRTGKSFIGLGKAADGTMLPNELFAWQFTHYYMDMVRGGARRAEEESLWKRVVKVVRGLFEHFFGHTQNVDPELRKLFERVMPSSPRETQWRYNEMLDTATGQMRGRKDVDAGDKRATAAWKMADSASKIDVLRGKLDAHLFAPEDPMAGALAEDLKAAAVHMHALLHGQRGEDAGGVDGMRAALRLARKETVKDENGKPVWKRDENGDVVKDAGRVRKSSGKAAGVRLTELKPTGVPNHWRLFGRDGAGEVMEQVAEHTKVSKALSDAGGGDFEGVERLAAEIAVTDMDSELWNSTYTRRYMELMDADPEADAEVLHVKAARYADERIGVTERAQDLWSSMTGEMDKGGKASLAMRMVALQVRDLMTDAMEFLDGKIKQRGYNLQRSALAARELPTVDRAPEVSEAAAAISKAAESSKVKPQKVAEAAEPKSDAVAVAAEREAAENLGEENSTRTIPPGAPAPVKAVVSRVTHRDPEQKAVIDGMGYDIFNLLDIRSPTNGDIAKITGVDLEPGVSPDAPAAASEAFDEFRSILRRVSEHLTNKDANPSDAISELAELMARGRGVESRPSTVANAVVGRMKGSRKLEPAEMRALEAADSDPELAASVTDIQADVMHLLALRTRGTVPGTSGSPAAAFADIIPRVDGGYHPLHAERAVASKISMLSDDAVNEVASGLGLFFDGGDPRAALRDSVAFHQPNSVSTLGAVRGKRVKLQASPDVIVIEGVDSPRGIELVNELASIDAALAKGGSRQEMADAAVRRQHVIEALRATEEELADYTDAVRPMLLDRTSFIDFGSPDRAVLGAVVSRYPEFIETLSAKAKKKAQNPDVIDALTQAAERGDGQAMIEALESALTEASVGKLLGSVGASGYRSGGVITVLDGSILRDFDEVLRAAQLAHPDPEVPDAPLAGEEFMRLVENQDAKFDSLGLQQRVIQSGGDAQVAAAMSRATPGKGVPANAEETYKAAKKFSWTVQLRENASRIRQAGANWLADKIKPQEGTGFYESLQSALGRSLSPITRSLDEVSGRTSGMRRWLDDLKRNGMLHKDEVPQSEAEKRISVALRTNKLHTLDERERTVALEVRRWFADMLKRQRDAGIPVGDIIGKAGVEHYLPQRFNQLWIRSHYDEAMSRLSKWFVREGRDEVDARVRAEKVLGRVMDGDEEGSLLGGALDPVHRSAFAGDLYARILNISSKDMDELKLHDLFDGNLRSLIVGYANNAETRIAAAESFGVKGHGFDTYMKIGSTGRKGAVEALTNGGTGYRTDLGSVSTGEWSEDSVGFASQIMKPLTRDPAEAERLVDSLAAQLVDTNNIRVKQAALTDMLVELYRQRVGEGDQIVHFRRRAEAIVAGLSDFGTKGTALSPSESAYMREFVGRMAGESPKLSDAERRVQTAAKAVMAFNAVSMLSMATVSSFCDAAMPLIRSGNFASWGRGLVTLAKQLVGGAPEELAAARNIGVSIGQVTHQGLVDVHGGRIGRATSAFFLANGLTPWTNTMRQVSAVVGFESLKAAQLIAQREKAAGNFESRAYLKNVRYLRQMGAADLVNQAALGSLSDAQDNEVLRRALHRFTNESVFEPNRNDIPLQFQDSPFWRLMFQFKSYPLMLGRMTKRAIAEAGAMETTGSGRKVYVGDVKPLAYMMTVGVGLAAGAQAARDVVAGRNQEADPDDMSAWRSVRDRKWSRIVQDLGFKDFEMDDEGADSLLGWYVESLMGLGALGMVGDMLYQSAAALDNGSFGRERIMSQILGPTIGGFNSALQAFEGLTDGNDESNAKERIGVRAVARRVPFVSGQTPWVEGITNWIAGEAETTK